MSFINGSNTAKELASLPSRSRNFRRYNYNQLHPRSRYCRRNPERVVFKSGQFNLEKSIKPKYHVFPDIVTTFVVARWRWTLVYCTATYMAVWLIFALIWWTILLAHGDLEKDHLPEANNTAWIPCVRQIHNFTSILLFSIEIHTTIGYGTRSLTLECPNAMVLMCIESISGTIIQSFIIGIVFAKLTRPKSRAQTLIFSKNSIICQRDGDLCLIFRVGDTRKSRIINVSVHAYLIRHRNKLLNNEQIKLNLTVDSSEDVLFMFPVSVVHKIDERSPFYLLSAYNLLKSDLEILVVFEGTIESTGQPVQAKSSYTTQEILWGHRFQPIVDFNKERQGFVVDYSMFDDTQCVITSLCSAEQLI